MIILSLVAVAVSSVRTQTVLMLCAFAFMIVGFVFLARPPRFLKPDWLVEQEQQSAGVGALALVVGGPVIAFLVRSGRLQKWPRAYYESDASGSVRNVASIQSRPEHAWPVTCGRPALRLTEVACPA
jgi:uncharacterized integral membrane protein